MSIIEELRDLSSKDAVERSFMHYIDDARQVAMHGKREITFKVMKKSFYEDQLKMFAKPGAESSADALYDSQKKIIERFRTEGFTVVEEAPSSIIIASVNESPEVAHEREFESRYLESNCTISW